MKKADLEKIIYPSISRFFPDDIKIKEIWHILLIVRIVICKLCVPYEYNNFVLDIYLSIFLFFYRVDV